MIDDMGVDHESGEALSECGHAALLHVVHRCLGSSHGRMEVVVEVVKAGQLSAGGCEHVCCCQRGYMGQVDQRSACRSAYVLVCRDDGDAEPEDCAARRVCGCQGHFVGLRHDRNGQRTTSC